MFRRELELYVCNIFIQFLKKTSLCNTLYVYVKIYWVYLVSGSVLPAHRAVLVARCDVMAAMFSGKYAEARSRVVPIHGVSSDTFLSFLEYLYTDTCCPASVLQAMAVLVCAEMYQVKRLQHLCEVCVCAYLQSMPSRELASTSISCHNADQLYVWLLHFIANNYLIFSHKPDFLELSGERSVRPSGSQSLQQTQAHC
uniref:BTB domain-containing protein n=1 Tax=Astyanax mexicanus TaxID=7994 RepID=A0A3B1KAK6_ASTMX